MVEHADLVSIVQQSVATSKELASNLQDKITESKTGEVKLSTVQVQAIASQLRITANLVDGFLKENETMLERINSLIDQIHKA